MSLGLKKVKDNFATPIKLTKEAFLICTGGEKATIPIYYKRYLYWCIIAGVGAYYEGMSSGESWINTEKKWYINALELKAILLSIMSIL